MKVGIYFPGFTPESGGGYSFEQSILTSLCDLAPQSRHHFTLLFDSTSPLSIVVPDKAKNLHAVYLEKPTLVEKMKALPKRIARKLGWRINAIIEYPFQKAVKRKKIEFMCFLTTIFRFTDVPYAATVWDIQHRLQHWFPEVSLNGEWDQRESYYSTYLRRAAYIITPNHVGEQELSFFYQLPKERFKILPHPTPQIEALPAEDEIARVLRKYQIPKGYLFYPAQFWPHKNYANLLLALQCLRDQHKMPMHLVLTGSDQGNMKYIQSLAEQMGLANLVHFLGFIPREDLIALYCGAEVLTFVTLFGPENLPPLEAFACGCPVIASDVAGAKEQLGDAALLIDGRKPEEIAQAVKALYNAPELKASLIAKGKSRAARFTSAVFVKGIFSLCDEFETIRRNWQD